MLEIFDQNPSSRVFHVDDECYVLYLGAHWDDYKPFLRLGTSVHLPEKLPPIVSTIVVPDVLTGSPLNEAASLAGDATPDTYYLGDVRTVNKLKKFLKLETIAVSGLKKADHETDDNTHVFVYSYKDGNLKIKYHKNEVFDLHRMERLDAHFVARAQAIKNEFGRSPFKLPNDVYRHPGFVVFGGNAYLIAQGEIAALNLNEEYFADLAGAGIDPDRLTLVRDASVDESIVRLFKRCRGKGKSPIVATSNVDELKSLAGIFRANSLPALKLTALPADKPLTFGNYTISERSGPVEVRLQDLEGPIIFGAASSKVTASVSVSTDAGSLTFDGRPRPLLDGCVYQFAGESLSRTAISERYLPEKNYPYRDMLGPNENNLIGQISFFFSELFAGRDAGKVLRTIRGNPLAKDLGKGAVLNPVTDVLIANTVEFVRFLRAAEPDAGTAAAGLASILEKRQIDPATVPAALPLVAEISYRDGVPFLFYRIAATITGDRVAHADRIAESIHAVPLIDFESERNRLADLVAGLANPEQMEEARLRRIAERKKPKPKEAVEPATEEESGKDGAKTAGAGAQGRGGRGGRSGSGRRGSSRGGPWRWIIPVAIVILLLAALFALLATDTIPNRWFGDDDTSIADGDVGGDGDVLADGSDQGEPDDTAAADDGTDTDASGSDASEGGEGDGETVLPEGWPPETLPAFEALKETPGVVITADRVIGPGGIEITVMDIINLVNRIATDNGYAPMHVIDPERPDPDWIYPGNLFVLPNGTRYTVVQGDTLWAITVRYMVARLGQDYARYVQLTEEYEGAGTTNDRQEDIRNELRTIGEESHSENFTKLVTEKLAEWEE